MSSNLNTTTTVYLVSGANRGIGFALVQELVTRPNTVVFAGARDLANATELNKLALQHAATLYPVKLTSGSVEDNQAAIAMIEKTTGHLDVVIANAGIWNHSGPLLSAPISEFTDHFAVNTLGPIVLFQAAHDLLVKSPSGAPHFSVIGSAIGSVGNYLPLSASAYGASKAAIDLVVRAIHAEHNVSEGLITSVIHPGVVASDLGNNGVAKMGIARAPVELVDSARGVLGRIDTATREKDSDHFWNYKKASDGAWGIDSDEIVW